MRGNSQLPARFADQDHRPLVLLVIGLGVIILHLCQVSLPGNVTFVPAPGPHFAWLVDVPTGPGLYRLPAAQATATPLPNRLRPLFFQPVAINSADRQLLSILPGIGPTLAARIVDYRQTNGNFSSADQLIAVHGIGPGKLKKIRNLLVFD